MYRSDLLGLCDNDPDSSDAAMHGWLADVKVMCSETHYGGRNGCDVTDDVKNPIQTKYEGRFLMASKLIVDRCWL